MSNTTLPNGCPVRDPRFPAVWPTHMVPVNAFLFTFQILYLMGGAAVLIRYRRNPFVYERGIVPQLMLGLSLFFQALIVYLRDAIGRDAFSCDAYLWFASLTAPLFCASIWIRLVVYHNQSTFAASKANANLELLKTNIFEHKRLREMKGTAGNSVHSGLEQSARRLVTALNPKNIVVAAASSVTKGLVRHGSIQIIKVQDLHLLKALTGEGFAFIILIAIMGPFLVTIGYRYSVISFYGHGCVGCILSIQETWIFFGAIITLLVLGLLAVLYWKLYKDPDPLWILHELFWMSFWAGIFTVTAIVVDLHNPGGIHTSGTISWGYLIAFGMSIAFGIQTFYVVSHSFVLDRQRKSSIQSLSSMTNITLNFDDIMNNQDMKTAFAEHLVAEFSIENLKFYDQVTLWEKNYDSLPEKSKNDQAEGIFRTFLEPNSAPLEVNVSASQRDPLIKFFSIPSEQRVLTPSLFETTKREIYRLMSTDSFNRFKSTNKFAALTSAARELALSDPSMNA